MTVLELLVVVGIVAVLLSLVMPAIQRTRESARRVQCTANLRELGLALHNAHDLNMRLPAGWSEVRGTSTAWGWASEILPQLDQSALFENLQRQAAIDAQANDVIRSAGLPVMICPSDLIPKTFTLYAAQNMMMMISPVLTGKLSGRWSSCHHRTMSESLVILIPMMLMDKPAAEHFSLAELSAGKT